MSIKRLVITTGAAAALLTVSTAALAREPAKPNFKQEGKSCLADGDNQKKVDGANDEGQSKHYDGKKPWGDCTQLGALGLYISGTQVNQKPKCTKWFGVCYNIAPADANKTKDFWATWPPETGNGTTTNCNLSSTFVGIKVTVNFTNLTKTKVTVLVDFAYEEKLGYLAKVRPQDDAASTLQGKRVTGDVVQTYGSGDLTVKLDVAVTVGTVLSDTNVDVGLNYSKLAQNYCFAATVNASKDPDDGKCHF